MAINNNLRTRTQNQNLQMNNPTAGAAGRTGGRPMLRQDIVVSASNNPFTVHAQAPQVDRADAIDTIESWLKLNTDELLHLMMDKLPGGGFTINPAFKEKFQQLPPDLAHDLIAQLANPTLTDFKKAFDTGLMLIALVEAAGETSNFSVIFSDDNLTAATQLFANNRDAFAPHDFPGLGNLGEAFSRAVSIAVKRSELQGSETGNRPDNSLEDVTVEEVEGGSSFPAIDFEASTFRQLHTYLLQRLQTDEAARKASITLLMDSGNDIDQATLTGFKADMDAIQGRMDIMSDILKDAGDYQKNLARKILA